MAELVAAGANRLASSRSAISSTQLANVVRQSLKVPANQPPAYCRRLFQTGVKRDSTGQSIFRFVAETEPDICCVLRHVCSGGNGFRLSPASPTTLVLPDLDSQSELDRPGGLCQLDDFWLLDVRGLGEGLFSLDDPYELYGHDYMLTGYALLYGESILGCRLRDVLATVSLLRSEGVAEIRLAGRRQGAILSMLAALLDPEITEVASYDAPASFLALASAPYSFWPAANFPRGVLAEFDLPEVRAALGSRLLEDRLASPVEFSQ